MPNDVVLDKSKYAVHELNVISSTKINQKTKQILRIFGVLPPVVNAQNDEDEASRSNGGSLATVIAVRAQANVASKLISIVEIVKRDLAKRAKAQVDAEVESTAGNNSITYASAAANGHKNNTYQLFQYTTITSTMVAVKPKPIKKIPADTTVSEELIAPETGAQQGQKRKRDIDSSQGSTVLERSAPKKARTGQDDDQDELENGPVIGEDVAQDDNEGEDEAFEQMRIPGQVIEPAAQADEKQEKEVAVLKIYLSMTPIAELAEAYGEQTS